MIRTNWHKAKLTAQVHRNLDAFLNQQTQLWNDALEERIVCCRKTGKSISFHDQNKSLTTIRSEDPGFANCHLQLRVRFSTGCTRRFPAFSSKRVFRGASPVSEAFEASTFSIRPFELKAGIR